MTDELEMKQPEVMEIGAIEQITRAEVDMQVATAKRYPRSITEFKQQALSMAIKTPEIARSCFYVLPRGGKKIEGPSVRLAEIAAVTWGNLRCESRVVGVGEKTVTAQSTVWDIQSNVLIRCETSRRITDKSGNRYNEDMITMTGNAAASIALRNALFKVVPMAYISEIYEQCKRVAAQEGGGIDTAKENWIKYFEKRGVSQKQVLTMLGKKGLDDVDIEDITTLQGLSTALDEGQTTIDQVFRPEPMQDGTQKFGFKGETKAPFEPPPKESDPAAKTGKGDNGKQKPKSKKKAEAKQAQSADEPPPPGDEDLPWGKHLEG